MHYTQEDIAELNILLQFNLDTTMQGIKVHKKAGQEQIQAARRLYDKGLITQVDGGYLTDLGIHAAEHTQALVLMLSPHQQSIAS